MPDIVPTAASLNRGQMQQITLAEETTVIGQLLARVNGEYVLASNLTSDLSRVACICMEIAIAGTADVKAIFFGSEADLGVGVLAQGQVYVLSTTGFMKPANELVLGEYSTFVGIAETIDTLFFTPKASGIIFSP